MSTALVTALIVFAVAAVISMGVALLIKVVFVLTRKINKPPAP